RRRSRRSASTSAARSARGCCSCDRAATASPRRRGRGRPPARPLRSRCEATTSGEEARPMAAGTGAADAWRLCSVTVASCNPQRAVERPIPAKLFLPSGATRRCARPGDRLDLVGAEGLGALWDDRGDDWLLVDLAEL